MRYSDIPFKYRYSYRDKKYRDSPVHRCIVAALADNTLLPSVISFDNANVAFLGHLESGSSVINTTEGRELSMDVSVRELTPIPTCWIVHSNFLKPGYLGRPAGHDFPPKLLLKNTHSAYSA